MVVLRKSSLFFVVSLVNVVPHIPNKSEYTLIINTLHSFILTEKETKLLCLGAFAYLVVVGLKLNQWPSGL